MNPISRENNCVRVGRIASLSADKGQLSSRETTRIRFGKAGAHPQLAWGTVIAPETLCLITVFSFLKAIAVSAILS